MRITYTHHCIKQIISKGLLYSTGKPTQWSVISYMGKKNVYIYIHIYTHTHTHTHIYIYTYRSIYLIHYIYR